MNESRLSGHVALVAREEAQTLLREVAGVAAVVIATADGFDVASAVANGLDPARIAALASSISAIGEVVSTEARLGRSRSVTVNTESGFAVVFSARRADMDLVLNVIATGDAVLGQVNYSAAAAARRLADA